MEGKFGSPDRRECQEIRLTFWGTLPTRDKMGDRVLERGPAVSLIVLLRHFSFKMFN